MCAKMRPVGVSNKDKKGQKLSCVKLAICPDHSRRRRPLKFCVRGRVLEVVIYFKFHENRPRGLRAVGGRKSPSPIDLAHGLYNSLYYRTSRDVQKACCPLANAFKARRLPTCTTAAVRLQRSLENRLLDRCPSVLRKMDAVYKTTMQYDSSHAVENIGG